MKKAFSKRMAILPVFILVIVALVASMAISCGGGAAQTVTKTVTQTATQTVTATASGQDDQVAEVDMSTLPQNPDGTIAWPKYYPSTKGKKVSICLVNITHSFPIMNKEVIDRFNEEQGLGLEITWADAQMDLDNHQQMIRTAID